MSMKVFAGKGIRRPIVWLGIPVAIAVVVGGSLMFKGGGLDEYRGKWLCESRGSSGLPTVYEVGPNYVKKFDDILQADKITSLQSGGIRVSSSLGASVELAKRNGSVFIDNGRCTLAGR